MKSSVVVVAELRNGRTVLTDLRSEAPVALRETGPRSPGAARQVSMLGSAAGPVGGDELEMTVRVGAGACLSVEAVAATMVFPAKSGAVSRQRLEIDVEDGGHLRWLGQPLLVIANGHHVQTTKISLSASAHLDFLDEVALGRSGELPGRLDARLRIERSGQPLLDQHQVYDATAPGWATSAGVGHFRHVRHRLVVGRNAEPVVSEVRHDAAVARFPLAPDAELAVTLGVDRCAAAD